MKCSSSTCGAEGQSRFCPECGSKMVEEVKTDTVVICNGKLDGKPCQSELIPGLKFCTNCGTKVDQSLFNIQEERCSNCSSLLLPGKLFCAECGHRKTIPSQPIIIQKEMKPAKGVASIAGEVNKSRLDAGEMSRIHSGDSGPKENANDEESENKNLHKTDARDAANISSQSTVEHSTSAGMAEMETAVNTQSSEKMNHPGTPDVRIHDGNDMDTSSPNEVNRNITSMEAGDSGTSGVSDKEKVDKTTEAKETENGTSSSDIGILDGSGTEDEASSPKEENKMPTGNLNIIPSSPNADLLTKFEDVNLDNANAGKVTIIDETKNSQTEEGVESADTENDSECDSDESEVKEDTATPTGTLDSQGMDGLQIKRNKKQKENKKKRKKEKDAKESGGTERYDSVNTEIKNGNSSQNTLQNQNITEPKSRSTKTDVESSEMQKPVFGQGVGWGLNQKGTSVEVTSPQKSSLFEFDRGKAGTQESVRPAEVKSKQSVASETMENTNNNQPEEEEMEEENDNDEGSSVDQVLSRRQRRNLKKKTLKEEAEQKDAKDKENKNKNKNQTPKASEPGAATGAKGNRGGTLKQATVYFHALISEDFKFDPEKNKVILRMEDKQGNWNNMSNVCTVKNSLSEYVYEIEFKMKVPVSQLTGKRVQYKYTVVTADKDKETYVWEHYVREPYYKNTPNSGAGVNRILSIQDKWKNSDEWHQYDGVIEKVPSRLTSVFFSWKKELVKHAKKSVQYFSNKILEAEDSKYSLTYVLDQLEILLSCMKKIYFQDAKCWEQHKEGQFKEEIGDCLLEVMLDKVKDVPRGKEVWDELRERQVTMAVATVYAAKKLSLSFNNTKRWHKICDYLILRPDFVKRECFEISVVEKYFPEKRKQVKEAFVSLAQEIANTSKDPSWLFLMPWIHFLSEWCSPFESPSFDVKHDKKEPLWWGLSVAMDSSVTYFTGKSDKWTISIEKVLSLLEPLFEVDYLLARTFITAVELKELMSVVKTGKFPAEVVLANLIFYVRKTKPRYSYSDYATTEEMCLMECISAYLEVSTKNADRKETVDQSKMRCFFSQQLVIESTNTDKTNMMLSSVGLMLHYLSCFEITNDMKTNNQRTYAVNILKQCLPEIIKWMDTHIWSWLHYMDKVLACWNGLYAPEKLQSESIREIWNEGITKALIDRLQGKICNDNWMMTTFVQLYCKTVDTYHPYMQDCMSKTAFKAIEKGYAVDYDRFNEYEIKRFGDLLSDLFLKEWNKSIRTRDTEKDSLNHFLKWPPFMQFVKIYAKGQEKMKLLSEDCHERLVQAVSVIQSCISSLLSGDITVGNLLLVQSKDINFPELADLVKLDDLHNKAFIMKAIQIRQMEMEAFHKQSQLMTTLTSLCQHLGNIDRTSVDNTLKKQEHIEIYKVKEFCKPADISKVADVKTFQAMLCAFQVSQVVLDLLPSLQACSESSIFMMFWIAECQSVTDDSPSLNDIVPQVWTTAKNRWDKKANQIKTGEIKFRDFEKVLGNRYKDDYERMAVEMKSLKLSDKDIRKRIDQLQKYRQLEACTKGAKTILEFARDYSLEGDFEQIRIIANHGESDLEMRSFDDSVMNACDFLKELTPRRGKCLKMFVTCRPLVQWLKESMKKSGLKELKVFVDLAFMSAGDEPINIARVQCLHSAVTGYAPLIFDLDEKSGYRELLNLCAVVWKELDANPKLPDKLQDTNRQLQWLKEIKKAHGSVEVTSLMQAEAINANGIFTVGKNAWKRERVAQKTDETLMVVADIIKLTVPEQEGKSQLRNYTFSQCQDLQSRLMLVAGKAEKGTDSVDRFTMIFDSITRLSSVYMKLCSSGCVLFKDWTARFLCYPKPDRPVCAILEFGQGDRVPQLKGRRSPKEDLKEIIPELAKFMECCLEEWLQHIKEKRKNFLHLNYYTVDQLVILQRELVKMGTESEPSHLVYPLLSAVKEDCTPDDLLEAMAAAKEEIDGDAEMEEESGNDSGTDEVEMAADATDDEKKQNFVHELVLSGYEEALAFRALEFINPEDVTAGIVWCMDHEEDNFYQPQVENEPVIEQFTQRPTFSGWSQSQTDIQTMITANISGLKKQNDVGSAPLISDLTALWKQFLESISSNIRDYLSLEHLGLILKYLARKDTREISRSLPPGFKEGQPNLIICPSGDVLMTTLSVYKMDKDQPLPQSDEILVCTANTTRDEVDIFWRRAIFDGARKIHCLVNADMLDYDVSEVAERCLEEYLLEVHYKDLKYRLLVICGSDNEYRSTIVSSLDKFKRQPLPANTTHLREYLANKLAIQQRTIANIKPAADVDKQRSTVRVIKSWRAGVGKTLFKHRREEELSSLNRVEVRSDTVSIPLQEKTIDLHYVIQRLLEHTTRPEEVTARLFHIDVSHEVENGVDYLLFNLLVLGCLMDKTGFVWRKSPTDIYLIETMPLMYQATNRKGADLVYVHPMLSILPDLTCKSPQESLQIYLGVRPHDFKESDQLFDEKQFRSSVFQRTFQYLLRLDQRKQLGDVQPYNPEGSPQTCLQTLLRHCGLEDPSWSELHHFVWFLNTQLVDFENNMFVSAAAAEDLPGFSTFVLRFLIQMSRDFSTRSLDMSEESPGIRPEPRVREERMDDGEGEDTEENGDDLQAYQMRRTWESSPHPYLFFNSDRFTFTFLGFFIDRGSGNLIDQQTRTVLENGIMTQNLYDSLVRNHAPMQENFDALPRDQKIMKLCNVMGIEFPEDPDDTYELTTDNVKKIMAIYMRFRCDIPVIIMGETGCGKTRLVKFMCSLQQPPGVEMTNMILMKVHGGTTNRDIIKKVRDAEQIAKKNKETYGDNMYTVLFFDEANTTEAIGLIKEIMCDKSMEGKKLKLCENLKMVAACNPYRKHSEELIKKLEQAGLGYHVDADETTDRLGRVPMRRLVYRVQPLPQSLLPLVWDFGQLNTQVEDLYIRQMVRRYIREERLPEIPGLIEVSSAILTASQDYMREQKDECSFVSLRDVDRVLTVMSWFYQQSQEDRTLYNLMDDKLYGDDDYSSSEEDIDEEGEQMIRDDGGGDRVDEVTRSLILALGVCYHACLKTRPQYRTQIARFFRAPCLLPGGDDQIQEEIESCQEVFLDHVHLEKNIARNMALRENVFMMVVCIELRIPLFLVGKPGSSKSLAKTIVSDAMQGNAAREELFRELKQAQMVSFQCSPLATPDGIVGTFSQCAQFQKDKDLDTFVSIVVLDEVGLAEDSPRMPLKTLHPLLEDGCQGDEKPEKHKKVAFIGISNWALDPAKMNRGILVQREVPDLDELINSATGICSTKDKLGNWINPLIKPMAISYLEIFQKASQSMREFYGLRDFYSLVKMVYSFVEKSKQKPTWHEMLHAIKRNFGGLDQVNPVESFRKNLTTIVHFEKTPKHTDPDCTPAGLVQACLFDTNKMKSESRYLLLLTENYGTLTIIQQQILSRSSDIRPITIFGSSFRSDQEYTQVCRNINKIKVCMETGNTVVLLNLENLYESLYDALNQYYVYFGGERYVDLGLGTHRVKCPVHKNFRLIVVAEKQTVYKKFPIPLINRLEKHFLTINTMLSSEQQQVVKKLEEWAKQFVTQRNVGYAHRGNKAATKVGDVFIGYHEDTCSAIVLDVWDKHEHIENEKDRDTQVLQEAKSVLLWCATPESLVRLDHSSLSNQEKTLHNKWYFTRQAHDSLIQYVNVKIVHQQCKQLFAQITTHSKLMAGVHKGEISKATGINVERILLLETLSSFDTEQQFSNRIQQHIQSTGKDPSLMVIQCDSGDVNANLIACARYCVMDEFEKMRDELRAPVHVVFIVQLPRGASFTGFQCGIWHSAHIDDLYTADMNMPTLQDMQGKSVAKLFTDAVVEPSAMETDEEIPRETSPGAEEMDWSEAEGRHVPQRQRMDEDMITNDLENRLRDAPLQLDDVLLDLRNVDKHGGEGFSQGYGQHRLNVKGLILACVQAALSMVKDKEENTSKETDRVALVLKLLHQEQVEGHVSFLHGICCLIAKLLKEKESKTHVAHMAHHWLINEAAASENINKAGTFRRSCIQTLENKVSPILAGIIAYLDTNDNLKILQEEHCQWKQELWLTFLNTVDAINLQFTDLQSPIRQSDLPEVVVMTTGSEGHMFSAWMPFSWLMINQINEILKLPHPASDSNDLEDGVEAIIKTETLVKVLSEHELGKVLDCVSQENIITEAVNEYIHDFVHTMYNAATIQEHQLVCQSVFYVTNQMANDTTESMLLHSLVNVHMAYQKLAPRLTYFRAMNSVWPECSATIIDLKTKNPDHLMFKEQAFTFSALCILLENLTPKSTDLNNLRGRSHWLNRVHRYRPIVEKVISLHGEDPTLYGAHRIQSVRRAKGLWSRVMVVKLFLEHVCASEKEDKITVKHCMPLWALLGEETDLKDMKSLACVEKFLKSCNKLAMKEYIGDGVKCSQCESVLEGAPIALPCKDVLCDQCYDGMKALGGNSCVKCYQQFRDDWQPVRQIAKKNAIDKLQNYQGRCNTFFMDIVSQLCFADNNAPSKGVVEKLLSYIFFTTSGNHQRTRDLSIFNTGIDPNPVFRSFLLQLFMRTSEDNVIENLERYLTQASGLIKSNLPDQEQQYVELCLLVIQCLEDMFTQEATRTDVDEIQYTSEALHRATQNIAREGLSVEKLYGLASARMGLAVTARYVADIVMNDVDPRHVNRRLRKLVEAAQVLCEDTDVNWTRIYLVKHICRCYGIGVYQTICKNPIPFLRWIGMKNANRDQVVEISDRYIVCGNQYKSIREAITKVVLGENVEQLLETVQVLQTAGLKVEPMLQLAVHREITGSYLYPQQQRKLKTQVMYKLNRFVQDCETVKNKGFMQKLIMNQLVPRHLVTTEGEDLRLHGIQCLIVHFLSVMTYLKGDKTLLHPLQTLMSNPQTCGNMFLPTMPQDDLEDIKEALLAARQNNGGENPVFYRCPNGHPYVIGNCGRPYVVARCKCGAEIGGQGHKLLASNTQDTGRDNTLTGHILGRVQVRGQGPKPERTLTPAYTATIRLLLHMSMFIGVGSNLQGVHALIKPDIDNNGVEEFLWAHIQQDVDDIYRTLGRSVDDVLLLMHTTVDYIMRAHNEGDHVGGEASQLSSKRGRNQWEAGFSAKFLQASLKNIDNVLKTNNQLLVQDQRLGADPLLCLLYETDTNVLRENPAALEEIPRVWRYRTPISLQHLRQEAEAKVSQKQHKVLHLFLKEDHHLRALRYIPSILRLHRTLFQKYQRKLDKAEASQILIAHLKREEIAGGETMQLLQDFADAWELVRESLTLYLCPTELGGMIVSKEYCNKSITDKTPISMLLPTTKEAGLCSYALLDFLMRKQNDFLDKYLKEAHRKSGSISSVNPKEVTSAHLISYDPQHDILPLVLANCQYSFEMGKGTKIEYDFAALERQLMDRFLFSKSRIDVGRVLMIDQMVYRTEFTNAEVFRKLADKIPQETLSAAVKTQICGEIRSLPDLCTSLDNLDITISFLKSTGGQPDKTLHEFMEKTLQMETTIHSQKAQQSCEFRHAQSLWLLLSLQKSKKMMDHNQHTESTFESLLREFHEELPDELLILYRGYMKKLSIDKLSQLVEVLHEYILLVVAVRQNPEDDDYTDTTNNKLGEWLYGYADSFDNPPLDMAVLTDFPKDILYKHSVHAWVSSYGMLREKQTGNYRRF
ncbi:E3 ubiquitin-protein ligase rnf213-alpha-like isoform X2 [Mercenaria mercenaria]|uniref:E3 ubiquitin-protein ligase rnf213-alpha-like isoform X2 n=1 Tax=Mercenaria mercenaria TaxID=6596 RepID=UPI00234E9926|nr:E3 ubiquitin-protein ligase rnf213-alpha-like isoform X2 [Mercenaria mercenaria]